MEFESGWLDRKDSNFQVIWEIEFFPAVQCQFEYSEPSNKHAANLILFEKIFSPTCLIITYVFIYFWGKFMIIRTYMFTYFGGYSQLHDHFEQF